MPHRIASDAIDALLERTEKGTRFDPLCATQVALAQGNELIAFETFGRARFGSGGENDHEAAADNDTLFMTYSVTKAITSAAAWILLQEGELALDRRVVDHIPEFGTHGKDVVTVEQLLTHTAGFPSPRLHRSEWNDRGSRVRAFAEWPLEWSPGSRFVYHGTSSMMVLAELITRISGIDYRDFIRARICEPLGLRNLHPGISDSEQARVAHVIAIGEPMTADERATSPVDAPVIEGSLLEEANHPEARATGTPAGGVIATAADIAMFYQGLLADLEDRGPGIWKPETLRDAWTIRNEELTDDMTGQLALRGLGVVLAGSEGKLWRGFADACSPRTFGHMGAGGQVSWADPETGLSFVFLTNGAHQNAARQGANGYRLSCLAASCVTSDGEEP